MIDVSYPYNDSIVIYPNDPAFAIQRVRELKKGDGVNVSAICMGTHTGTHIDAPIHFVPGGRSIDQISLAEMNGPARLLDLRGNGVITEKLLTKYRIAADEIIILKTDNTELFHADTVLTDYVTLDYGAAEYLVRKKIKMVCIDYMTVERPAGKRATGKSIHNILLSAGVLIAETLKLDGVEEGSYQFYCLPVNLVGADGAPVRIALEERKGDG